MKCVITECDKEATQVAEFLHTEKDGVCRCHLNLCFAHKDWYDFIMKSYRDSAFVDAVHSGTYEECNFDPDRGVIHTGIIKKMWNH